MSLCASEQRNTFKLRFVSFVFCGNFIASSPFRLHEMWCYENWDKKNSTHTQTNGRWKMSPSFTPSDINTQKKNFKRNQIKPNQTKKRHTNNSAEEKNIHTDTKRVQNDGIFWRLSFWFSIFISEQCLIFLFVFYIASLAIIMMAKIRIRKYSRWFIPSTFFFFLSLSLSLSLCFCWLFACPCLFLFSLILSFAAVCRRCQCFCKMIVFDEKFSLITIYLCMRAILNHIQIHTLPSFQFDFAMQKWPKRNESVKK